MIFLISPFALQKTNLKYNYVAAGDQGGCWAAECSPFAGDIVWHYLLIYHSPFLSHPSTIPANIPASAWWACMDNDSREFRLVCFCFVSFHPRLAMIAQCCLNTGRNTKVCNQPVVLSAQKLELLYSPMLLIFFRKDYLKRSLENASWFFFFFIKNP